MPVIGLSDIVRDNGGMIPDEKKTGTVSTVPVPVCSVSTRFEDVPT